MSRAKYDAALAIARACPGDNVIEIREMAGYHERTARAGGAAAIAR
jgi:chromate transport protein ChrA